MADKIQLDYSLKGGILPEIKTVVNYNRRIADGLENILPDLTSDHLTSVTSKSFYVKEFDASTITSDKIQLNGLNNLWLDLTTKQLII